MKDPDGVAASVAPVRRPNIRDVAALADVSPATVSMVLNNKACISDAARKRVLKAVKDLQYRRGGVGRPGGNRQPSLQVRPRVVFRLPRIEEAISSIYASVLHGAESVLQKHGIDLIVQSFDTVVLPQETIGLLSVGQSRASERIPEVVVMGMPLRKAVDQITYDNREIGVLAAQFCLQRELARVSFFNFSEPIFAERTEIFRQLLQNRGKELYVPECVSHARLDDPEEMETYFRTILAHLPPPLLFFSPADDSTLIAYPVLHANHIRPGREILFISCNNESFRINSLENRPAVIDIRAEEIGRLGALQLLHRIEAGPSSPLKLRVTPQLLKNQ